jgi:hypothetical protein
MRTGPFSDAKVIELLNNYFTPVYTINEDYAEKGPAPREEKAEYQRIYHEAVKAKLSTGTVHVYVLTPDGHPLDSLHVAEAAKKDKLIGMLEKTVKKLKIKEGKPLVKPVPQSVAPKADKGSLVLHLTSRPLRGGGSWDGVSENWIVLDRDDVKKLLPEGKHEVGTAWDIDKTVSTKLYKPFYPVTENNDLSTNRIDSQFLRGTIVSVKEGIIRGRLEGKLKMKHAFYPGREDDNFVVAEIVGYVDFKANGDIETIKLVTEEATYGGGTFGVAVRLVK